jgi:ADP-ribose pyrophosphatase YjhB (NUDIX family)
MKPDSTPKPGFGKDQPGERAVCIIIDRRNRVVLLMRRIKAGREYHTLPGGKLKVGETPAQACSREALEETGLCVTVGRKVMELFNLGKLEHYFVASSFSGRVALGGPERQHNSPENFYEPLWVPIERIEQVNLLPVEAVEMVKEAAVEL